MTKKSRKNRINQRAPTVLNTGYSETSASQTRTSMAGWNPVASSPDSDIIANRETLVARSRNLTQGGAPIATSAINTSRVNVIGAGLVLSAAPDSFTLKISIEEAKEWARKTQTEFDLWANSRSCDLLRMNNFYDMQDIAYTGYLINGDGWASIRYRDPLPDNPYSLRIHVFESDRVRNPNNVASIFGHSSTVWDKNSDNGNRIISGVEIDNDGAVVAYWIANNYSYDPTQQGNISEFARVEAFDSKFGMANILQIKHDDRAEQYRGTPYLAPVIESLKQMGRFTQAELTSAIVKAYLSVFITKDLNAGGNGLGLEQTDSPEDRIDPRKFQLGPGTLNTLPPGYKVSTVDGSRSMSSFDPFMNQLVKEIGASLNIPYEVLMKNFQSSYSAARAALLQGWQEFRTRRMWFTRDFCQPIYERWLLEAVAMGRIKAPGFFADPLIRAAWSKSLWNGPVPGAIDREKEIRAAAAAVNFGFSTHEKETREMGGGDWNQNIENVSVEQKIMKERGIVTKELPATLVVKGGEEE